MATAYKFGSKGLETSLMVITPELALKWLEDANTSNRNLSQRQVDKLAYDMVTGNWRTTHQGIAFYDDGTLADGQHRLAAIAKSGIAQTMLVITGLSCADSIGIDQHRPRSVVDTIRIVEGENWINKNVVAISRFLMSLGTNRVSTISQIREFAHTHKECILFALSTFRKSRRYMSTAPVFAAVTVAAMNGVNREKLAQFSEILLNGAATSPTHLAAIRLREWLMKPEKTYGALYHNSVYLRSQRAIEAFAASQPLGRLFEPSEPIWTVPLADYQG